MLWKLKMSEQDNEKEMSEFARMQGFAKGQAEERKNLLAAGRALLDDGMDRLKVQRLTKLSDEEMASICEAN